MTQSNRDDVSNMQTDELDNSLKQISAFLSAYIHCQDDNLLTAAQRRASLLHKNLLTGSFPGVEDLVFEIISTFDALKTQTAHKEMQLNALCQSIIILPRYINYIKKYVKKVSSEPQLLIPYINNLRACQGKPLLAETHYADFTFDMSEKAPVAHAKESDAGQFKPGVTRDKVSFIRRMYVWGLVDYLKTSERAHADEAAKHLKVMKRALIQLTQIHTDELWVLGLAYIENIEVGSIALDIGRKRLLADIDRQIQSLSSSQFLDVPAGLKKDLLYLIYTGNAKTKHAFKVFALYNLSEPLKTDQDFQEAHAFMYNPDQQAVDGLIGGINDALNDLKPICLTMQEGKLSDAIIDTLRLKTNRAAALMSACGVDQLAGDLHRELDSLVSNADAITQSDIESFSKCIKACGTHLDTLSGLPGKTKIEQRVLNVDLSVQEDSGDLDELTRTAVACEATLDNAMRAAEKFTEMGCNLADLKGLASQLSRVKNDMAPFTEAASFTGLLEQVVGSIHNSGIDERSNDDKAVWTHKLADAVVLLAQYLMSIRKKQDVDEIQGLTQSAIMVLSV